MPKPNFKFELGSEVKEKISGYQGIVVCRCEWLTGCNTYGVRNQILKDGKPMESIYFDEDSIDLLRTAKAIERDLKFPKKKEKPGGDPQPVHKSFK